MQQLYSHYRTRFVLRSKIILNKESGDTVYFKMNLVKKEVNEDMWFHKITFTYFNVDNKISHVVFTQ